MLSFELPATIAQPITALSHLARQKKFSSACAMFLVVQKYSSKLVKATHLRRVTNPYMM